jgi:hypothetical protein
VLHPMPESFFWAAISKWFHRFPLVCDTASRGAVTGSRRLEPGILGQATRSALFLHSLTSA